SVAFWLRVPRRIGLSESVAPSARGARSGGRRARFGAVRARSADGERSPFHGARGACRDGSRAASGVHLARARRRSHSGDREHARAPSQYGLLAPPRGARAIQRGGEAPSRAPGASMSETDWECAAPEVLESLRADAGAGSADAKGRVLLRLAATVG